MKQFKLQIKLIQFKQMIKLNNIKFNKNMNFMKKQQRVFIQIIISQ